jgi:hypothetical protein
MRFVVSKTKNSNPLECQKVLSSRIEHKWLLAKVSKARHQS